MVQDINLVKGQKVDLTKDNAALTTVNCGLFWDANTTGDTCDLDAFALLLENGKYKACVYFNNLTAHGVTHSGDERTGASTGDDETIRVDFANVDASITEIILCVNIYEATEKRQNFGQVRNAGIRVYNGTDNTQLCRFDLNEDYSVNTGVQVAKLYRKDAEWKFSAEGVGLNGTITEFIKNFS